MARAVSGYMLDYFEFEGGFAMARTKAPSSTWDKSLYESRIRTENSVTVVGVKRAGRGAEEIELEHWRTKGEFWKARSLSYQSSLLQPRAPSNG